MCMPQLRHLVLFKVRPEVADSEVAEVVAAMRQLGAEPGLREWRVEMSMDVRTGRVIVENARFMDEAALAAFRVAPAHRHTSALMANIADWLVGDYFE